jgi:hypothetical protein
MRSGSRLPMTVGVVVGLALVGLSLLVESALLGGLGLATVGMTMVIWNRHMADGWQLRLLGPLVIRRAATIALGTLTAVIGLMGVFGLME